VNRYDLVILGFIAEKPSCGYDIVSQVRERELDRWAEISPSTIYNRLAALEKKACITGKSHKLKNRPDRITYTITDKGREALGGEVLRHLTGFNDDPRTLGYAFIGCVDSAIAIRALESHAERLREEIKRLDQMIAEELRPTLYPKGPFLNCMSRDHILVEYKYARAAVEILKDPQNLEKLKGYFYINFGSRDWQIPSIKS
jgi:DNA-binding PadR family transcriptional regulator